MYNHMLLVKTQQKGCSKNATGKDYKGKKWQQIITFLLTPQ